MYSCTSGVWPAIAWLRFSRASAAANVGGVDVVPEHLLRHDQARRGEAGDPAGQLEGGVVELVVGDEAGHETHPLGLVGVDLAAGHDHVERPARADEAGQQVADPDVGAGEPGADERRAEARRAGRDAQVAGARERQPAPERCAAHRGDDDLGGPAHVLGEAGDELLEADPDPRVRVLTRCRRRTPVLEVQAGAEPAAGPVQDHDPRLGVAGDGVQGVVERGDQVVVHRVEPIGSVQGEARHVRLESLHEHDRHQASRTGRFSGARGRRRRSRPGRSRSWRRRRRGTAPGRPSRRGWRPDAGTRPSSCAPGRRGAGGRPCR